MDFPTFHNTLQGGAEMKTMLNEANDAEYEKDRRPAWLWLLIGFILLPFTAWQTVIPLAAWFAPVFLLRFLRTSRRAWVALPLIYIAHVIGILIAGRGMEFNLLGLTGNILFKELLWTLPYAADCLVARRLRTWPRVLVFPVASTVMDWVISLLRVSTSGSPAYSQNDILPLIQIVSITGMWGLTFMIMWFASTMNMLWEHNFNWRPVRGMAGLYACVLLAAFLFGIARVNFAASAYQTVTVATITNDSAVSKGALAQFNWVTFYRLTDEERAALRPKFEATVNQMFVRTETALRRGAKIVGWAEESAWVLAEDEQNVLDRSSALAKRRHAYLEVSLGVFTRAKALHYLLNKAILIDNTGHIRWTYVKTHPVPFDEAFVTIAGPGVLPNVVTPYGRMSTAICYDTYFLTLIRQAGQNDVDILLAPSNDFRPLAVSASVMATYRAVENGFSMIRAAGKGISIISDYDGRLLGRQDYFTNSSGIMLTNIPTRGVRTIYSRIGDLFAYLCLAALVLLTVRAFANRKRPAAAAGRRSS
jgi:apolipoprotein N-acyltransferase